MPPMRESSSSGRRHAWLIAVTLASPAAALATGARAARALRLSVPRSAFVSMSGVDVPLSPLERAAAAAQALGKRFGASTNSAPRLASLFAPRAEQLEAELRALAASGGEIGATLKKFAQLERAAPPPADLLRSAPGLLDGRWLLLATVAAEAGESVASSRSRVGAVNASGIVVDASSAARPVQEICVERGRIGNEIVLSPLGQRVYLRVGGSFGPAEPPAPGTRAIVSFDSLELFTEGGMRLLSAGWVFQLLRSLNPALQNGKEDASWLETTYISERMRLGRGNKGSVFILERLRDGGGPLARSPL
ncbi:hypothetical protein KFE25_013034 [Diacronema lutheri]|uniref:Plastid lipid-associated protein/fibrillin conserved domain-containing protein n=1 Tax=Diacronema lutheri TaxID=2081491 RepID=A0A8J6C9G3_DIALT|nr:hypothetical protein KFE25_013034 [Diacronema lutheri]